MRNMPENTYQQGQPGKRFSAVWACLLIGVLLVGLASLSACAGAMPEAAEESSVVEEPAAEAPAEEVAEESATEVETEGEAAIALPTATPAPQPTFAPTPTPLVEPRLVEVEWPQSLYLGDSDVVRMALIPSAQGYTLTTEFPDHTTTTQEVPIVRPEGYELWGVARLNGVGFTISPAQEQISGLPLDQAVTWHWSLTPEEPGQQRLTVSLLLRWEPLPGTDGITHEAVAYSKGLEVQVKSFLGLSRAQTLNTALIGFVLGGGMVFLAVFSGFMGRGKNFGAGITSGKRQPTQIRAMNRALEIESSPGLTLLPEEENLLRALFQSYQRLHIQQEFLSGYSGARTFLALPIRADGRSDAPAIAKLGPRAAIEQEFANYEAFVKRTLPPVTARIQSAPVALKNGRQAALQYTFIGAPGRPPVSLRQALLADPDPQLLTRLFETFGPNWWMQRRPWVFGMAQEYDRLLPPHWALEPDTGRGAALDGRRPPAEIHLTRGELVTPQHFTPKTGHLLRGYLTLQGQAASGQPALRLRWLNNEYARGATGRVTATRLDLLHAYAGNFDLLGLPDPLEKLPARLQETVRGTRSIIHGDLNLENVLIGPGGMVWLIDFAATREGHPLMDFAHLEAEIIVHVIAPQMAEAGQFLVLLRSAINGLSSDNALMDLLSTLHEIAFKCLANPSQPREYWLALYFSCLGALKYRNLDAHQKYLLYLTAAQLAQDL